MEHTWIRCLLYRWRILHVWLHMCRHCSIFVVQKHSIMLNKFIVIISLLLPVAATACSGNNGKAHSDSKEPDTATTAVSVSRPMPAQPTGSAFIVVSKRDETLTVYDYDIEGNTVMVAQFPCCMGKNKGDKQSRGDMRTPESPAGKPFRVTMIQDASTWKHDFNDGRGSIKAYGHWFLRLATPGHKGIGIHGSTNNEHTVPGRASEGCIRLLDKDIITLKEHFAYVNMPVIVQPEDQAPFDWELRARNR